MKYIAVIFDIDDTLFDYRETEKFALSETCRCFQIQNSTALYNLYREANNNAKRQIDITEPQNLGNFRQKRAMLFLDAIHRNDVNPFSFIEIYLQYSTNGVLIDGVKQTLEQLKNITKVAATNGSDYPRKTKLMNSVIGQFFSAYYSSESIGISKPDPSFFDFIIKDLDIPKEKCLIVGDNYDTDIKGALAAHIDCCWFNYRGLACPDSAAITTLNHFKELLNVVKVGL